MFEDWQTVGGGDGFYNVVDPVTNRYLYNESQFGSISRTDLYTGEVEEHHVDRDQTLRFNWNAPILVSPHDSNVVYHAANKLLQSADRGDNWVEISPDLTTNDKSKMPTGKGGDGNIQYGTITTVDESPLVRDLIWVGTDDGNVQVTKDGGKSWTKLNDKITGQPGLLGERRGRLVARAGHRVRDLHRAPQRRLPRVRLQDHRLRPDVDVDCRQPAGQVGQRDPRGSEEPEPAVRRRGLRPLRDDRRRQDVAAR